MFQKIGCKGNCLQKIYACHNLIFGPPQGVSDYDFNEYHRCMVNAIKTIYTKGMALSEEKEADPEEVSILALGLIDLCLHMDHVHQESLDPKRSERLLRLVFQGLHEGKTIE